MQVDGSLGNVSTGSPHCLTVKLLLAKNSLWYTGAEGGHYTMIRAV